MHRSTEPRLARFDRVERAAHWANAVLFAVLLASGLELWSASLMALIGRRRLVEDIHLAAGLALPIPVLLSLAGRYGAGLRADLGRLNRWSDADVAWIKAAVLGRRRGGLWVGKFNAGQKLNTAFTGGAILVMLLTGVVMYWYHPWPLAWRTGATYTHEWLALGIVVVIAGHVTFALRDPDAMGSMLDGTIPRGWADTHAPAWVEELEGKGSR